MRIAKRLQELKPSATMAVSAKAMELRAQGREIISLSVGETDFPTPEHVRTAAKAAVDEGYARYTQVPGLPEVREAVAGYFNKTTGTHAEGKHTIVTNGGKQGLFNLFQCLLDPGDEVLVPAPYWVSYPAMVQLAQGVTVTVPTFSENGFKASVEDFQAALTDKTRVLLFNSPSNPTGAAYTRQEIDAIMEFALDKGLYVVSDEIYDQLVYPPAEHASLAPWWEKAPEQVAVMNGLSKSFSMTGWRVGYCLAHEDMVKALSKIQGQSTSCVNIIAQKAAIAALNGPLDELKTMRNTFMRRRDLLLDRLNAWTGVSCPTPEGAFYVFPDFSKLYDAKRPDSTTLCTWLLEEAGVATVPGAAFGEDRCIRLSYALDDAVLMEALDRIGRALGLS